MGERVTWEYLAGFFDGEGCVSVYTHRSQSVPAVRLSIGQQRTEVLYQIIEFLGCGNVSKTKLQIYGRDNVRRVMEGMLPHAIVKARELRLALELMDSPKARKFELMEEIRGNRH